MYTTKWLYQEAYENAGQINPTMSLDNLYRISISETPFVDIVNEPVEEVDKRVQNVLLLQEQFEKLINGEIVPDEQEALIGHALLTTSAALFSRYSLLLDLKEALWCKYYINTSKYTPLQGYLNMKAKGDLNRSFDDAFFNKMKSGSKGIALRSGYNNHNLAYKYLSGLDGMHHYRDGLSVEEFEYAIKYWLKYMFKEFSYRELSAYLIEEMQELNEAWTIVKDRSADYFNYEDPDLMDRKLDYSLEIADIFHYIVSIGISLDIDIAQAVRKASKGRTKSNFGILGFTALIKKLSYLSTPNPSRFSVRKGDRHLDISSSGS